MKKFFGVFGIFIILFGLTGCGAGKNKSNNACDANPTEVVLVTDIGGVNDQSFNQSSWEGLQKACSTLGIGASYIESKNESDFEGNLRKAAGEAKIVVASGFVLEKPLGKVAQEFPDVNFVFIDGEPKDEAGNVIELPNVFSYYFREGEAGYLVGYIAGKMTKSNRIGFIGGLEIPSVQNFGWGYLQGAQAANPNVIVEYQYTNTFNDSTIGNNTANSMFSNGVDIIFTAAGGTNKGVVQSAIKNTESGNQVYVIGVDRDMYDDGLYDNGQKSVILTSAIKNVGEAVFNAVKNISEGNIPQPLTFLGFEEGYVGIPENNPNLANNPEVVEEAKNSLTQAINNGTLVLDKDKIKQVITIQVNGQY